MTSSRLRSISEAGESVDTPADPAKREEQARALCLRLLTVRARTRSELQEQLTKRGYPGDVSTAVLNRLGEVGLVDDAEFAEQ